MSGVYDAGFELREARDGSRILAGRFPYMTRAVLDAGGKGKRPRKEQFASGAFSYAVEDLERDIHLLSGHSFDRPLASRKAGSLKLNDTAEALEFEAVLGPEIQETSWVRDLLAAFAAGLIGGISPGFRVAPIDGAESSEREDPKLGDAIIRTIHAAVLFELSLVTRPAYPETGVDLRNWQHGARAWTVPIGRNHAARWR